MDIKPDVFDLEKELAQSKINIDLNEINSSNKFLIAREWDYCSDDKIFELESKVETIINRLDKKNIQNMIKQINSKSFKDYFNDYKITENKYKISCLSSLNFLVESTYYFRDNLDELKQTDLKELEPYVDKFRGIKGDGDCFYRGLIFSIMENIILTNNIMHMKELLILYSEKINKNNQLVNEKEYLNRIKQMNVEIVSIFIYIIINQMEVDISKAYRVLLIAFLFFEDFDFSIIFFTRYLFYEYISANEDKIYSTEYQLEIGCLLPDFYVIDKGDKNEYLFENYYNLLLMNPKSFAEKIVLYVAPYVFNINMNVLVYDYGTNEKPSNIQQKEFCSDNKGKSKIDINLIFRKSHYDLYYIKKFYEENKENLNILLNPKENEIEKLKAKRKSEKENEKRKESQAPKKSENEIKKNIPPENNFEEKNQKKENLNEETKHNLNKEKNQNLNVEKKKNLNEEKKNNLNKENKENKNLINDNYKNDSSLCSECFLPYSSGENIFSLCDECLLINLKQKLSSAFYKFLKNKDNLYNSKTKLQKILENKKYPLPFEENISLWEAIDISKYKFEEIFLSIRSQLCLYCGKTLNIEDKIFIELPCKCRLCSPKCFLGYFDVIEKHITIDRMADNKYNRYLNFLTCFCGFTYNSQDVLYMINELEKNNMKQQKLIYQKYILNIWNWKCFLCHRNFEITVKFLKVFFKCPDDFKKLLNSEKEFKHLLCEDCFNKNDIKNKKVVLCKTCELQHEITEFKGVNEKNEEDGCIIL